MREYLLILLTAAIFTYVGTTIVRLWAQKVGAVTPVRARDVHSVPTPRMGGVGMLIGFASAVLLATQLPFLGQLFETNEIYGVLIAAVIITALGALDDVRDLDWSTKLAGQVLAGGVMAFFGVRLLSLPLFGVTILPEAVLVVLTILIVVFTTNAVNFVDGLDGLAAGIVLISAGTFFSWTYVVSRDFDPPNVFSTATLITAAIMGCCIGFLPHNFHPARLFMGDAGALLLGLLLSAATISMTGSVDPSSSVATTSTVTAFILPIILPVAILALPLLDIVLAVIRRTRRGDGFWKPDASHLHHQMLAIGHSHRRAVSLLYLWSAVIAAGAVSYAYLPAVYATLGLAIGLVLVATLTWRPWHSPSTEEAL
ncbi:undecaprenyl/decaprenyl-phosphate alpha-N-acetylglucosaminyl 1-phosphate transferase [Ornithinimicrobium sp. Arc0846-15]|nr:undecaprenyl/decaprenyl-phosphate alpha-N-acetylglucosaminyl 1-phosphate transferase [Ornithinimicrobium laminariae]